MNVAYLTTDDPLYLLSFFARVLSVREDTAGVFVVPPLYKNQTMLGAAWRYVRTFGPAAASSLTTRTMRAKVGGRSTARVCERHDVPYEAVDDVNDPSFLERLRELETSLIVSVSCPQLFKKPLIELAPLGCLYIHGAILPEDRGVMPSFWMLANGERKAGVSIFFVNEDIDAGDLCGLRIFEIREREALDEFLRRSKVVAADLLLDVLEDVESGAASRTPLNLSQGS